MVNLSTVNYQLIQCFPSVSLYVYGYRRGFSRCYFSGNLISLNIASEEDKEKINQYLYQYIHTDINKIETIFYKIPQLQKENL